MKTLDYTGLNENKVSNVVKGLTQLLANFQVYYANLRGFHWNVKGHGFFILHSKYEELYNDAATKIDDIAERLLQLDAAPESKYSEYLKVSTIKEAGEIHCGKEAIESLLGYLKTLIALEREILSAASEAGDEVTVSLMSDYLKDQEKSVWMFTAFAHNHEAK